MGELIQLRNAALLEANNEVKEIDARELAGGGIVRAMYNFSTLTPYIEVITPNNRGVVWVCEPDKVSEHLEHPGAYGPHYLTRGMCGCLTCRGD